jgi:calpain
VEWRNLKDSVKKELGLTFDDDGEFYMDFNLDFLKYFGEIQIVHKTPDNMMEQQSSNRKYEVIPFHGAWTEETAGGCLNDISNYSYDADVQF